MKKLIWLLVILTTPIYLSGCWDQKVLESTGFILQIGVESTKDNQMLVTYTLPVVDPKAKEKVEIMALPANLFREAREKASWISARGVEGGKNQQLLISDVLGRHGIYDLFEIYQRDSLIVPASYVVIVEGSPKETLESLIKLGDKPLPAFYISQLLRNNIARAYAPEMRMYKFNTICSSPGIDPITPILKLQYDKGKGIEITGSALFSEDKMVGKINTKDTSLLLAMMGEMKQTTYICKSLAADKETNVKTGAAIFLSHPKRKLNVKVNGENPKVDITLSFKARIEEYKWNSIPDIVIKKSIENTIAEEIKNECTRVLKYTQEVACDPIGIGDIVRAKYNAYWENVDWKNVYKGVVFKVSVNVNIQRTGLLQ